MEEELFSKEEKIQRQFEAYFMKVLHDEAVDCYRALDTKSHNEKLISSLTQDEFNELFVVDAYCNEHTFVVMGFKVLVANAIICDALHKMPKLKQDLILLYYFLEFTDKQIAVLLNSVRTTVCSRRIKAFELLKKIILEDYRNE